MSQTSNAHLFICGGVSVADDADDRCDLKGQTRKEHALTCEGEDANVHIKIEDLCKSFVEDIPDRFLDLLEIASYVYAADRSIRRPTGLVSEWTRDFHFVIPVVDLSYWSQAEVRQRIEKMLLHLTSDRMTFRFVQGPRKPIGYFDFGDDDAWPIREPERVFLFSGGLDSLAGAVQACEQGKDIILVSHRSGPTISKRQQTLLADLRAAYPKRKILQIPVHVNLRHTDSRDSNQRTRSFLFATAAALVAESTKAKGIRFYENGVISLNLPVADEVVGARASNTTHPRSLSDFEKILSSVFDRDLIVDNPFIRMTKTEVIEVLRDGADPNLIGRSVSCVSTRCQNFSQPHCGECSQCIDRRIAILAAGADEYDSEHDYLVDVFTGPRANGYGTGIALDYVKLAHQLKEAESTGIAVAFADAIMAASRYHGGRQAAEDFSEMLERHGNAVVRVVGEQFSRSFDKMMAGKLVDSCLLKLVLGNEHNKPSWKRLAAEIVSRLESGLPVAVQGNLPKNETALQKVCDGLLKSACVDLDREFPFVRWGVVATKPDLSRDDIQFWVEFKYARKKSAPVLKISDEIAADITKYGDAGKSVLFVVYDPERLIVDDESFRKPIESNEKCLAAIIR